MERVGFQYWESSHRVLGRYLLFGSWTLVFTVHSLSNPEGPSTQHLRSLVSNTIQSMIFGTRNLKYWVLGPSG